MTTICVFTMSGCQYCEEFKGILKKENLSYEELLNDLEEFKPDLILSSTTTSYPLSPRSLTL